MTKLWLTILFCCLFLGVTSAGLLPVQRSSNENTGVAKGVRPVIFMHGIFGTGNEVNFAQEYLPLFYPGIKIYYLRMFTGLESAEDLGVQMKRILPAMQEIMDNHTDTGVTLLCYSQGGVICRGVVQMLSTHNVHTFIALSSPLAGQFGVTGFVRHFTGLMNRSSLWEFWYSELGRWISVGDYWNDPHHQGEFSDPSKDIFLARLNNQTGHSQSQEYKKNFLKLEKLVMIGGPDDTVITPWQSAQLGFYNQNETVLPFEKQPWYERDEFGLRSLHKRGGIVRHTHPGVHHTQWYKTPEVFDKYIIPYLQ